jgi:serine/threonine protein kinase
MLALWPPLQQLSRLWRRRRPVVLELPAGTAVHQRYEILCQLGGTLYDRTYLAEDWWYSGWCVLTEFAPRIRNAQELALAREQVQEAVNLLQQLDHPQIPQFREVFECQVAGITRWVVVQEWIEGLKYSDLAQSKPFTEAEVVAFLRDTLPALDYLHRQKPPMLHRNLKPSTLIQSRENGKPALIKFGDIKEIAVLISRPNPKHQVHPLDRRFQPPEYEQGDFYPSGDLYGLAVTALTLLTGCPDPDRLYDRRQRRWRWAKYAGVSIGLAVILERMLQVDPELRYPSAKAVMSALDALSQKKRVPTPKPPLLLSGSPEAAGSARLGNGGLGAGPGMTITVEAIKQTSEVIRHTGQGLVRGVRSGYASVQSGWGKLRAIAFGQLLERGLRFGLGFCLVGFVLLTGYAGIRAWQVLQARQEPGLLRPAPPSDAAAPQSSQGLEQPPPGVYGAGESKLLGQRAIASCGMDLGERYGRAGSKSWQEVDRRFTLAFPSLEPPLSRRNPDYDFYLQEWCYLANAWLEEWGH